ncbi:YbhN family protein [Enterovibrio sp. 27052020O]|uniref:lysylphosphatidylglycerol synthase transmembrane domain-containing protein n=1 Tax=Enterovibrio sp. 27052020O TaxID=3241166 RepID=UPI00388F9D62
MMQNRFLRIARRILPWIVLVSIVLFFANNAPNLERSKEYILTIPLSTVLFCLVLALVSYFLRLARWLNYMSLSSIEASIYEHTLIYFSGLALTFTPGKVGELTRGFYLTQRGVPFRYTFACCVSERLNDLITVMFIGAFFLAQYFHPAFIVISVLMVPLPFLVYFFLKCLSDISETGRYSPIVSDFVSVWMPRIACKSSLFSFLAWSFQGVVLYFFLDQLGAEVSIPTALSVYCLSLVIGAASLIPGGIVATELGMVWLLTYIGVDKDLALISSIGTRAITLLPAILVGLLSVFVLSQKEILVKGRV